MTSTASAPLDAFIAIVIHRANTGSESRSQRVFLSLEGARDWLVKYFQGEADDYDYPADWDEEDFGCPFPDPNELFSLEKLKANLEMNKKAYFDKCLWGPESQYQGQAPTEYFIKEIKIYS